jgi:hypothetical protein
MYYAEIYSLLPYFNFLIVDPKVDFKNNAINRALFYNI